VTHCRRNTDDLPVTETQLFVALRVTPIATLWRQATVAVTRQRRYTGYHYALTLTTHRHDHITTLLADLLWLRIPQRIQYKLCVLVYQCVQGSLRTELPAERHLPGRECGITASPALRVVGRSHRAGDATYNNGRRTAPSPSQHRAPRTVCRTRSVAVHLWLSSNVHSKLTFIFSVFINIVFNYF